MAGGKDWLSPYEEYTGIGRYIQSVVAKAVATIRDHELTLPRRAKRCAWWNTTTNDEGEGVDCEHSRSRTLVQLFEQGLRHEPAGPGQRIVSLEPFSLC